MKLPAVVALFVTIFMTAISATLVAIDIDRANTAAQIESASFNEHLKTHIELLIDQAASATDSLATYITSTHTDFQSDADRRFIEGLAGATILWHNLSASPNNCIAAVAPFENNKSAIGYCLNSNKDEWSAIKKIVAAKTPKLYGPFQLAQGGEGYIWHKPVFLDNGNYWGLVSAVVEKNSLIQPLVTDAAEHGFVFDLSLGENPNADALVIHDGIKKVGDIRALKVFESEGGSFTILSQPIKVDNSGVELILRRMIVISIIAILSAFFLARFYQRQSQVRRKLTEISKHSPSMLFQAGMSKDGSLTLDYLSEGSRLLLGIGAEELIENPSLLGTQFSEKDMQSALERMSSAKSPGELWSQRFELTKPVGNIKWLQAEGTFERLIGGEFRWNGVFVDATQAVEKEAALALTSNAIAILDQGVAILDPELNLVSINPAVSNITGYFESEVVGRNLREFGDPSNPPEIFDSIILDLSKSGFWRGQFISRHKSGSASRDFLTISAVRLETGEISELVLVMNSTQESLADPTSGLANRTLFEDYLAQAVLSAKDRGSRVALLHIGVTGVGAVNDSFGHKIGDQMLREIGERLIPFSDSGRSLARLANAEFGLFCELAEGNEDLDELASRVIGVVSQPFIFDDVNILGNVSVGIAVYPDNSLTVPELRTHADQAYKLSLTDTSLKISHFSKNLEVSAKAKSYLTSYLKEAIEKKSIEFHYQPIISLRDGSIAKAEVLARWHDEHLGQVSPSRFIPLAENTNLINALGNQLLDATLETMDELQAAGKRIQFSVNVSPNEFMSTSFEADKSSGFKAHSNINREDVVFELTEGILVRDSEVVQAKIALFKAQGIRFAIDDFGTGYSSLSYLQKLDVDFIKIDKAFVDDIETPAGLALCKSVADLAHALGLQVIAEGVESSGQVELLKTIECEFAQGYYFSKALPKADFLKLLS